MTDAAPVVDQRRMPQAGETLGGKYLLEQLLAVGGMGHIYIARHVELGERVCVKVLSPQCADEDGAIRFFREARAAAKLKSVHVVRILDVNRGDKDTLPFIVMELLDGRDVRYRIKQGPAPVEETLTMGIQICDALAEAHSFGIVHRDIKPANLVLVPSSSGGGMIKVLDFGISKMANETVDVTSTGTMMGSPAYMPPEQVRSGRLADARADIWAVGVVLYELLTCTSPFQRDHVASTLLAVVAEDPPPPHTIRQDIPKSLSDAIVKCLRKRPADRFQAISELAAALRAIALGNSPLISMTQTGPTQSSYPPSSSALRTDIAMATTHITSTSTANVPRASGTRSFAFAAVGMLLGVSGVVGGVAAVGLPGLNGIDNAPIAPTRNLSSTSRTIAQTQVRSFVAAVVTVPVPAPVAQNAHPTRQAGFPVRPPTKTTAAGANTGATSPPAPPPTKIGDPGFNDRQ